MKKGFTLTEILITIIIIAVLAAIAFPGFSKSREKSEAAQAVNFLQTIRLAEKMYYAKNATYLACADAAAIKTNLGAEIKAGSYTFKVEAGAAGIATSFLATATGVYLFTVDEDGDFTKDGAAFTV